MRQRWDSPDTDDIEVTAAERELLDERLADPEANPEAGRSWEDVERDLRARDSPDGSLLPRLLPLLALQASDLGTPPSYSIPPSSTPCDVARHRSQVSRDIVHVLGWGW